MKFYIFLFPTQTKRREPILVSCEAPFRSKLQKNTGPVRLTGPLWSPLDHFFCKLLLNGALIDTKIGCISLVWVWAKKYKFSFLLCADPLKGEFTNFHQKSWTFVLSRQISLTLSENLWTFPLSHDYCMVCIYQRSLVKYFISLFIWKLVYKWLTSKARHQIMNYVVV